MIVLQIPKGYEEKAKEQIEQFKKIPEGRYRYEGVEAWRGLVCEFVVNDWLKNNGISIIKAAKGIDTSGKPDPYDILTSEYPIEVASATKNRYNYVMPKKQPIDTKSDDMLLIGTKYNDDAIPCNVEIYGFMKLAKVKTYPVEKNKGAPYYKVPLIDFEPIEKLIKTSSGK